MTKGNTGVCSKVIRGMLKGHTINKIYKYSYFETVKVTKPDAKLPVPDGTDSFAVSSFSSNAAEYESSARSCESSAREYEPAGMDNPTPHDIKHRPADAGRNICSPSCGTSDDDSQDNVQSEQVQNHAADEDGFAEAIREALGGGTGYEVSFANKKPENNDAYDKRHTKPPWAMENEELEEWYKEIESKRTKLNEQENSVYQYDKEGCI